MHFIIFGAGAVGATLGVRLQQAEREVLLVGRPATVETMMAGRFTLVTPSGPIVTHLPATTRLLADDIRPDSALLLCIKSQQVSAAVAELREVAPPTLPIVCLQNGVRAEAIVQAAFANVYSGLNIFSSVFVRDGEVRTGYDPPAAAWLEIGRFPSGIDELCGSVAQELQAAGIIALRNANVLPLKYGKLLGNLSNAVRAIVNSGLGSVSDWAHEEAEDVIRQAGLSFSPSQEIADRTFYLRRCVNEVMLNLGSTWQSLIRGVDTEVDYLNGEIVRIANICQRRAPINQLLVDIVHKMERDGLSPGFMTPAELEAACDRVKGSIMREES